MPKASVRCRNRVLRFPDRRHRGTCEDQLGSSLLRFFHEMNVGVHRDPRRAVAEPRLRLLHVAGALEHKTAGRVPKQMQAVLTRAKDDLELVAQNALQRLTQHVRVRGTTVGTVKDVIRWL